MEPWDSDVFKILFPGNEAARASFAKESNETRYISSHACAEQVSSREPTPAPNSSINDSITDQSYIQLRFSDELKDGSLGWRIGRSTQTCDVIVEGEGISKGHCTIVCEEDGCYLMDTSTFGTAISYDFTGFKPHERGGKWLIAPPPGNPLEWGMLEVLIGNVLFSVQLPNHNASNQEYKTMWDNFTRSRKITPPSITALGLDSAVTTQPPGTPQQRSEADEPQTFHENDGNIACVFCHRHFDSLTRTRRHYLTHLQGHGNRGTSPLLTLEKIEETITDKHPHYSRKLITDLNTLKEIYQKPGPGISTAKPFSCTFCSHSASRAFDIKRHYIAHAFVRGKSAIEPAVPYGFIYTLIERIPSLKNELEKKKTHAGILSRRYLLIDVSRLSKYQTYESHGNKEALKSRYSYLRWRIPATVSNTWSSAEPLSVRLLDKVKCSDGVKY